MARNTATGKTQETVQRSKNEDKPNQRVGKTASTARDASTNGTPIETYKGDPSATHTSEVGDIEEETLDRNAPFNKTYGIKDES